MSRYRRRLLLVLAVCLILLPGCGEGSGSDDTAARIAPGAHSSPNHPKLAIGSKIRDCDITFDGPGPADWRKHSLWIGPFGLAGPGPGPDFDEGALEGGLLTVKTPTMVAGHRPVTISVPGAQRYRVGILGVHPRPALRLGHLCALRRQAANRVRGRVLATRPQAGDPPGPDRRRAGPWSPHEWVIAT